MFVCPNNNYLKRMKFIGEDDRLLTHLVFWANPFGEWKEQIIPDDYEIIGFYANVTNCNFICRLGFIIWNNNISHPKGIRKDDPSR